MKRHLPYLFFISCLFTVHQSIFAQCTPPSLAIGLIGLYQFDGDGGDSSTTFPNHAIPMGGLTYSNGVIGQAADLDGIDDCFVLSNNFSLNNDLSMGAWIYPRTSFFTVLSMRDQCSSTYRAWVQFQMLCINNELYSTVERTNTCNTGQGGDRHRAMGKLIPENCWTHVAVTVSNNSSELRVFRMFINGIEYTPDNYLTYNSSSAFSSARNYTTTLGCLYPTGGTASGKIDQLRVYNRVLSPCEVNLMYLEGIDSIHAGATVSAFQVPLGDSIHFSDTSTGPQGGREWFVNGNSTSTDSLFSFYGLIPGTYIVDLIVTDIFCNQDTVSFTVTLAPPLDHSDFEFLATGADWGVNLSWNASADLEKKTWEITKSVNGIDFEELYSLPSSGEMTGRMEYFDSDAEPSKTYFYQLHRHSRNGEIESSRTVTVRLNENGLGPITVVSPNPFHNHLTFSFGVEQATTIVRIKDQFGKEVSVFSVGGGKPFQLDTSLWQSGVYFVEVRKGASRRVMKLVKGN